MFVINGAHRQRPHSCVQDVVASKMFCLRTPIRPGSSLPGPRTLNGVSILLSGSSGVMVAIPADRALPISANDLNGPPDLITLYERIGGAVERVPHFTCYEHADLSPYEHVGTLVRCIVLRNRDQEGLPINERAQNAWMRSLFRQRCERLHEPGEVLRGTVLVVFGRQAFMARL